MAPTPLRPILRACMPWLLVLLLVGITVQTVLATSGLLSSPSLLQPHRSFAPWLTGSVVLVVAIALIAKDIPVAIGSGAILTLFLLQGSLIRSLGFMRSLHAVGALLSFAICILLLRERLPLRKEAGR